MEHIASGLRHHWYSRIVVQPGIWVILFLPLLLVTAIGQEVALYHYAANEQQLSTQYQAAQLSTCQRYQPTQLSSSDVSDCIGSLQRGSEYLTIVDQASAIPILSLSENPDITPSSQLISRVISLNSGQYFLDRNASLKAYVLVTFARVPDTNWIVISQIPIRNVLLSTTGVPHVGLITGPLAIILICLAFVIGLLTSTNSLRRLVSRTSMISQGALTNVKKGESCVAEVVQPTNKSLLTKGQQIPSHQIIIQQNMTKITEVQEAERQRLSHDLHDETMQGLVAIGQRLQLAQRAIERDDKVGIVTRVGQARELNQLVMDELRRTIRALRPSNLDGVDLLSALESLTTEFQMLNAQAHFSVEGEAKPLHPEIELATFRVAQEALSNVRKHSQAKHVKVMIQFASSRVILTIQDDGIGFLIPDVGIEYTSNGHYGLIGMSERVCAVGGELAITSAPGKGTLVQTHLPYLPATSTQPETTP